MAGLGPQDLHELAEEFLDACIASLDTIPVFAPALGGAPERSFISPGPPALDCCDQLTVHWNFIVDASLSPGGNAMGTRPRYGKLNLVQLVATIARCVPIVTETNWPAPEEMEAAAAQLNADSWAIWNHTFNLVAAGLLFQRCGEVFWEGLNVLPPSGGCGGSTLGVRIRLDGYQEEFGT